MPRNWLSKPILHVKRKESNMDTLVPVQSIRKLREETGCGLKEAVEAFKNNGKIYNAAKYEILYGKPIPSVTYNEEDE